MTNGEFRLLKPGDVIYHTRYGRKVFGYVSAIYKDHPNLIGLSPHRNPWEAWIPLDDPREFHVATESEAVLWKLENL